MKPWHLIASCLIGALLTWLLVDRFREPCGPIDEQDPRIDSLEQLLIESEITRSRLQDERTILLFQLDSFSKAIPPTQTRLSDAKRTGRSLPIPAVADSLLAEPADLW